MLPFLDVPRPRFNPARLPGLAAWYDAADSSTVLTQVGGGTNFVAASSQFLTRANNASLQVGAGVSFTVTGWANYSALVNDSTLAGAWNFTGNARVWRIFHRPAGMTWSVSTDGTGAANAPEISVAASTGVWVFFCGSYDASTGTMALSINNATPVTQSVTITATHNTNLFLGSANGTAGFYNGALDEITFHKRVLTADERTFLYNSGAGRTYAEAPDSLKTNLVSWWSMNAPASGNWLDQHGSNHLTPSASRPTATTGVTFNVAQDGQTVRRWLSRHNPAVFFEQADLALQPVFTNSTTGLTFDGVNDFMNGTSTMAGIMRNRGYGYIFAVAQDTNPTAGSAHDLVFFNVSGVARVGLYTRLDGNFFRAGGRRLGTDGFVSSGANNSNSLVLLSGSYLWAEGLLRLAVNGVSSSSANYTSGAGPSDDSDSSIVRLGYYTGYFPGNIREIIVCNEQLTDAQILATRRYLQRKWGTPALP